jgi:hypothetical protein
MRDYRVIDEDDPEEEAKTLEFELDAVARIPPDRRCDEAIRLSLLLIEVLERHGHREPPAVLQRPAR